MYNHIESRHAQPPGGVPCQLCGVVKGTRQSHRLHIRTYHQDLSEPSSKKRKDGPDDLSSFSLEDNNTVYEYYSVNRPTERFIDLHASIKEKVVEKENGELRCGDCGYVAKKGRRDYMYSHIEAKHVKHDGIACQICDKICSTRQSHRTHLIGKHNVKTRAAGAEVIKSEGNTKKEKYKADSVPVQSEKEDTF